MAAATGTFKKSYYNIYVDLLLVFLVLNLLSDAVSGKIGEKCLKSADCVDSGAVCKINSKTVAADRTGSGPLTQQFDPSTQDDYIDQGLDDPTADSEQNDPAATVSTVKGTNEMNLKKGAQLTINGFICTVCKVLPIRLKVDPRTIELDDSARLNDLATGLEKFSGQKLLMGQKLATDKVVCKISGYINKRDKTLGPKITTSPINSDIGTCVCDKKLRFPCSSHHQCQQRFNKPNIKCYKSDSCPNRIADGYCRIDNKTLDDEPHPNESEREK